MTLEKIMEIAKWAIIGGQFIAFISIFIGIISPLVSPNGRPKSSWIHLGIELMEYTITAGLFYTLLSIILKE